jgi:rSAM/selenodomain-associated transferase 2
VISVIVPVKCESPAIAERFRFAADDPDAELLIAAAGDEDAALMNSLREIGALLRTEGGARGARLHRCAGAARGDVLLFFHADSQPPQDALRLVREAVGRGSAAGAFSLAYAGAGPALRWIAAWANLRSRWMQLPFGDQGIFCTREAYERVGGFRNLAICDDLDFVRRLGRETRLTILPQKTVTSPRRYRERGPLRQVLRNWRVQVGYFAGVAPEKLERWYYGK